MKLGCITLDSQQKGFQRLDRDLDPLLHLLAVASCQNCLRGEPRDDIEHGSPRRPGARTLTSLHACDFVQRLVGDEVHPTLVGRAIGYQLDRIVQSVVGRQVLRLAHLGSALCIAKRKYETRLQCDDAISVERQGDQEKSLILVRKRKAFGLTSADDYFLFKWQ